MEFAWSLVSPGFLCPGALGSNRGTEVARGGRCARGADGENGGKTSHHKKQERGKIDDCLLV